jgi:hypothetical protein
MARQKLQEIMATDHSASGIASGVGARPAQSSEQHDPQPALRQQHGGAAAAGSSEYPILRPDASTVANDDAQVEGGSSLIRKTRKPLVIAIAASAIWLLVIALAVNARIASLGPGQTLGFSEWSLIVHGFVGPILFIVVLTMLFTRNDEIRKLTEAVTGLAAREMPEPRPSAAPTEAARRDIAAMADGVERAIARASELQSIVRSEIGWIESTSMESETKLREVIHELGVQRASIAQGVAALQQELASAHDATGKELQALGEELARKVERVAEKACESIGQRAETVVSTLDRSSDRITDAISLRGNDLLERLNMASIEVGGTLTGLTSQMAAELDQRIEGFLERVERAGGALNGDIEAKGQALSRSIAEAGQGVISSLSTRTHEAEKTLRSSSDTFARSIEAQGMALSELLSRQNTAFTRSISGDGKQIAEEIAVQARAAQAALADSAEQSRKVLETAGQSLASLMAKETTAMRAALVDQADVTQKAVSDKVGALYAQLGAEAERFKSVVEQAGEKMLSGVSAHELSFTSRISASMGQFETLLESHADHVSNGLATRINDFAERFNSHGMALETALTAHFGAFQKLVVVDGAAMTEKLSAEAGRLGDTLWEQFGRAEHLINGDAQQLLESIQGWHQTIGQSVTERAGLTLGAIENGARLAGEALLRELGLLEVQIQQRCNEVAGELGKLAAGIDAELFGRLTGLSSTIAERSAEMSRVIEQGGREMSDRIGAQTAALAGAIVQRSDESARLIADKSNSINELLGSKALAIAETLDHGVTRFEDRVVGRLENVSLTINERGQDFIALLRVQIETVSKALSAQGDELRRMFSTERQNMATAYGATGEMIQNSVQSLTAQLSQAGKMLEEMMAAARSELDEIEASLKRGAIQAAGELKAALVEAQPAVNFVNAGAENLRKTMNVSLTTSQNISVKLAENVRYISESSASSIESIDKLKKTLGELQSFEQRLSDLMSKRGEQIESSLRQASLQSKEIGYIGRSFSASVEQTIASAEKRAGHIGASLLEAAERSAKTAAYSIQDAVRAAVREPVRTEKEQPGAPPVVLDLGAGLAEAAQQFQAAAKEMRAVSAAMQRETSSRQPSEAQLLRPASGAESPFRNSAADRETLASQMRQLDELARMDENPAQRQQFGDTSSNRDKASQSYRAPPQSRRDESPDARRLPDSSLMSGEARRNGQAHEPEGATGAKVVRPSQFAQDRDAGTRTSDASLIADIEQAIDHEAVVDLWRRYHDGETALLSRNLYTRSGERTFDEVRQRYTRDHEFQETVNRYIDEFERLLEAVARRERDSEGTTPYLTSQSGKIYTLLAHASGRFG